MDQQRRFLLFAAPALAVGLFASREVLAAEKIRESDPTAAALGYKEDASRVDAAKYRNYVKGSTCANCSFYRGKANEASAPCAALGGKLVASTGWCSAWVKK